MIQLKYSKFYTFLEFIFLFFMFYPAFLIMLPSTESVSKVKSKLLPMRLRLGEVFEGM